MPTSAPTAAVSSAATADPIVVSEPASTASSSSSSSAQPTSKPAHQEGKRWQARRPNQRGGGGGGGGGSGSAGGGDKEWVRTQRTRTADGEGTASGGGNGGSDDEGGDGADRVPKKKYAVMFGYAGTRYQGLQINGDAPTVEKALEQAIFDAGGLLASNHLEFQKVHWSRACRTDKGVHAAANVVSLKMNVLDGDAAARINACLPDDIRVFAVARCTKSFNAWKECNERRYEYTMPTYCLQPMCVQKCRFAMLDFLLSVHFGDFLYRAQSNMIFFFRFLEFPNSIVFSCFNRPCQLPKAHPGLTI